jgi:hypothetical protein
MKPGNQLEFWREAVMQQGRSGQGSANSEDWRSIPSTPAAWRRTRFRRSLRGIGKSMEQLRLASFLACRCRTSDFKMKHFQNDSKTPSPSGCFLNVAKRFTDSDACPVRILAAAL